MSTQLRTRLAYSAAALATAGGLAASALTFAPIPMASAAITPPGVSVSVGPSGDRLLLSVVESTVAGRVTRLFETYGATVGRIASGPARQRVDVQYLLRRSTPTTDWANVGTVTRSVVLDTAEPTAELGYATFPDPDHITGAWLHYQVVYVLTWRNADTGAKLYEGYVVPNQQSDSGCRGDDAPGYQCRALSNGTLKSFIDNGASLGAQRRSFVALSWSGLWRRDTQGTVGTSHGPSRRSR